MLWQCRRALTLCAGRWFGVCADRRHGGWLRTIGRWKYRRCLACFHDLYERRVHREGDDRFGRSVRGVLLELVDDCYRACQSLLCSPVRQEHIAVAQDLRGARSDCKRGCTGIVLTALLKANASTPEPWGLLPPEYEAEYR